MRCLKPDHKFSECKSVCSKCGHSHHAILCKPKRSNNTGSNGNGNGGTSRANNTPPSVVTSVPSTNISQSATSQIAPNVVSSDQVQNVAISEQTDKITVLQTAKTKIISKGASFSVTLLFDTGSDRSYILSDIAKKAKLNVVSHENIHFSNFGNNSINDSGLSPVYDVKLFGKDGSLHEIQAIGIPTLCNTLLRSRVPQVILDKFDINDFSDDFSEDRNLSIQILVGLDYIWSLINPSITLKSDTLVAHSSVFGYFCQGNFMFPLKLVILELNFVVSM